MGDLNSFLSRIAALRQSIVDDGMSHGIPFQLKDIQTLIERLESEGSSFVKVTLPLIGKALDQGLISGQFYCPTHFRTRKDTCLPIFCYDVFHTIFEENGHIRLLPNVSSIFFLRQFLMLDGKLLTEPTKLQKKLAIDGFRDRQRTLGNTKVPTDHPVLVRAQKLLTRTLKHCDLSSISPGHGPGGVQEGYNRIERWDIRAWPLRAERWYPFHEYGSQSFLALCQQGAPRMVRNSHTKCCLVPKDFKGPRLISAESTATQYLQQGQMKRLMRYIDNHWLLSKSIKLKDQTFNQQMCRTAYENGSATLDLSNASDTVSAALVWYLFAGVPKLRSQIFCTRSQSMKIDQEHIRITAFAPMGSALCFPVETLVFWAISMASVRFVQFHWSDGDRKVSDSLPNESETASAVAVFGDDIIVPDYALATLIGTLELVGCEANKSKTCFATKFRESCGSEWYNNIDVTFTRNRRFNYDVTKKFINYPVLLDLQRKFFLQGLGRTAALLLQWAREISPVATIGLERYGKNIGQFLAGDGSKRHVTSSYRRWNRLSGTVHNNVDLTYDGGLTGFPSGVDRFVREQGAFDTFCSAIGWDTSLDCGVPIRYNKAYQRLECRLPRVFQRTEQWNSISDPNSGDSGDKTPTSSPRASNEMHASGLNTGYPRLLARLAGDTVERIAIRNITLKMAWSELPIFDSFKSQIG